MCVPWRCAAAISSSPFSTLIWLPSSVTVISSGTRSCLRRQAGDLNQLARVASDVGVELGTEATERAHQGRHNRRAEEADRRHLVREGRNVGAGERARADVVA